VLARRFAMGFGAAAVAALVVVVALSRQEPQTSRALDVAVLAPSKIATGAGEGSRLTFGDVVLDVASDTRAEIRQASDGATVLDLERGSVDCDIAPRAGRPPFRVRAGAVTVTVVGTRFTVWTRGGRVRVDVARGKVAVAAPDAQRLLGAGESWSSDTLSTAATQAHGAPTDADSRAAVEEPPVPPVEPSRTGAGPLHSRASAAGSPPPSPNEAKFARAQRLERTAPEDAARLYRELAAGRDTWAALAVYSLADLRLGRGQRAEAARLLDEYQRRFPGGANGEEIGWLRIQVAKASDTPTAVAAAAKAYLSRYPAGAYAARAHRILDEETLKK
jgi:hypothetical protein